MLSFSEASNLAIHSLAYLAAVGPDARLSASTIAARLDCSESHVAKVLNRLVNAGLLASTRGAAGGFSLAVDPQQLSVREVLEAIDGPLAPPRCLLGHPICGRGACVFEGLFKNMWAEIAKYLSETKLTDFRIQP